ncbi:MAG: aminopeptidase [Bdellovibrionaceae bacterium]|nr:aminopeptidase [Pseudobdellovibrionaceae bacterium]
MDVLKSLPLLLLWPLLTGCQIGYLYKSARSQLSLLSKRVPIEEALRDPGLDETQKEKLRRAQEAHDHAVKKMSLKEGKSYTSFVQLDRPYVSYVVSAAPRWKLEHHEWSYPIVGRMPYRGFADENDAKEEQGELEREGLDTFLRGVSAYSTLGWFNDPVLSSMLRGSEAGLVNTIIHETVHTTLYIRNSADFNERLAVFVGNRGTEEFYLEREGPDSPTVKRIRDENADDALFSDFIGPQIRELKNWYERLPADQRREELREERFRKIQSEFRLRALPKMKTASYKNFPDIGLNNARLLYYRTYMQDLSDFESLYAGVGSSWKKFLDCARTLEKAAKPEEELKTLVSRLRTEKPETLCP